MINYLLLNDDYLLDYSVNGNEGMISFDEISKYSSKFDWTEYEEIHADICGDNIVVSLLSEDGQCGILFVWDTLENKLIHMSEGSFVIKSIIVDSKIYSLAYVYNYVQSAKLMLYGINLGVIDEDIEGEVLNEDIIIESFDANDCSFVFEDDMIFVNDIRVL